MGFLDTPPDQIGVGKKAKKSFLDTPPSEVGIPSEDPRFKDYSVMSGPVGVEASMPSIAGGPDLPWNTRALQYMGATEERIASSLANKGYNVARSDKYGLMVQDKKRGTWHPINDPGVSNQDIVGMAGQSLMVSPAGKAAQIGGRALGTIGALGAGASAGAATAGVVGAGEEALAGNTPSTSLGEIGIGAAGEAAGFAVQRAVPPMAKWAGKQIGVVGNMGEEAAAMLEKRLGKELTPDIVDEAKRLADQGRWVSPLQIVQNIAVQKWSNALTSSRQSAKKLAQAFGFQSEQAQEAATDLLQRYPISPVLEEGVQKSAEFATKVYNGRKQFIESTMSVPFEIVKRNAKRIDLSPEIARLENIKSGLGENADAVAAISRIQKKMMSGKVTKLVPDPSGPPGAMMLQEIDSPIWEAGKVDGLFNLKYDIQDIIRGKKDAPGITDKDLARRLIDTVKNINGEIDAAFVDPANPNSTLSNAFKTWKKGRRELEQLRQSEYGRLGTVENIDDKLELEASADSIFDAARSTPKSIKDFFSSMRMTQDGSDAADDLLGYVLLRRKGQARDVRIQGEKLPEGQIENTPGAIKRALFGGNEEDRALIHAAMKPDQQANMFQLEEYLNFAERGRHPGSSTSGNLAANAEVGDTLLGKAIVGANMVTAAASAAWDFVTRKKSEKNLAILAEAVTSERWAEDLKNFRVNMELAKRTQDEKYIFNAQAVIESIYNKIANERYPSEEKESRPAFTEKR